MCKPIAGNFVRARRECEVKPLQGSSDAFLSRSTIILSPKQLGMVDETPGKDNDHRVIMFEFEEDGMPPATLVAELHCSDLKGVEL